MNKPQRINFMVENVETGKNRFDYPSYIHALECYIQQLEQNLNHEKSEYKILQKRYGI